MIDILSWTTKKHQKTLSRPLHSKSKKMQGLFKDLHRNLRTFQDCANPVIICFFFVVVVSFHFISFVGKQFFRGTQRQFSENICLEDDFRSRIFGVFVVKFLACLPLPKDFRTSKNGIIAHF